MRKFVYLFLRQEFAASFHRNALRIAVENNKTQSFLMRNINYDRIFNVKSFSNVKIIAEINFKWI